MNIDKQQIDKNAGITQSPEGPITGTRPGAALPHPVPQPFPGDDPRGRLDLPPTYPCTPVSGLYKGELAPPHRRGHFPPIFHIPYELDLRVDVDSVDPNATFYTVLNKVSGDIYRIQNYGGFAWRIYQGSWIVDNPSSFMDWPRGPRMPCRVVITGAVRFYRSTRPPTNISIVINQPLEALTIVTFTEEGSTIPIQTFTCQKVSSAFRQVTLEVDVCQSVNTAPILPTHDTNDHPDYPGGLPRRLLSVAQAYLEAGIDMTINPTHSIIDDTALPDTNWRASELHDAMETYFSRYPRNAFMATQQWNIWGMLASGVFEECSIFGCQLRPDVAGVLFDYRVDEPDRQGCAVFREHQWYNNLPSGPPANVGEAWALRQFLYTYVHEIGHAFNLLHSWEKHLATPAGTSDDLALSWMNYPQRYDIARDPSIHPAFWNAFRMEFQPDELVHIRHGDLPTVIFGGEDFGQGAALENLKNVDGEAPIQFIIRGKRYFRFLEPVILEFKLKNNSERLGHAIPIKINADLTPENGSIFIQIQRHNGRVIVYEPIAHMCGDSSLKELPSSVLGRHCQNALISFGKYGHYIDEPGIYRVRAMYHGLDGMLVISNVHELRVGTPLSHDEEKDAQDFYSRSAGLALYLGGSDSAFLQSGMDCLREISEKYEKSPIGAHLSLVLAQNLSRPFRRLVEVDREKIEVEGKQMEVIKSKRAERKADPQEALNLVNKALQQQEQDEATFENITYHYCRRTKADLLADIGQQDEAQKELDRLIHYLRGRGVKEDVLSEIDTYKGTLSKK